MSDAPAATKIRNLDEVWPSIEKRPNARIEVIQSPFLEYQRMMQSPQVDNFQPPTREDLSKANTETWNSYAERATKVLEDADQKQPPTRVDLGNDSPRQHADKMKAHTQSDVDELTDKDLAVVGKVGKALQRGDLLTGFQALQGAYNEDYDKETIANVSTGIRLELFRRGLNQDWDVTMTMGNKGAYGVFTDLRANGMHYPGLAYPSYSFTLGQPEKN
jgi:hypothetical protein